MNDPQRADESDAQYLARLAEVHPEPPEPELQPAVKPKKTWTAKRTKRTK